MGWKWGTSVQILTDLLSAQGCRYAAQPLLPDPKDDMVLEVAVASGATHIVTFNHKDLHPAKDFGIAVVKPAEFIQLLP